MSTESYRAGRALRRTASGRVLVAVFALALAAAGCRGGEASPDESPDEAQTPASSDDDVSQSYPMLADLDITATGAAQFHWAGRREIQYTRFGSPDLSVNQLTLGFMEPVITQEDPKNRFRWAFDLVRGYEDKPGVFTLDSSLFSQDGLRNNAFLIWMRVHDGSKAAVHDMAEVEFLKEFGEILRPCTLEVGPEAREGKLECPELASEEGETTSLTVVWKNGEPTPEGNS